MDIVKSMRDEYGHSKKWINRTHFANLVLLATTIAVIIFGDHLIWGILALLVPIFILISRCIYTNHYDLAEKMRRLLLLMDSLGIEPSAGEIAQFGAEIGKSDTRTIGFRPPYYNSKLEIGNNRLAENIAESAFFTQYVSKCAKLIFTVISMVGVLMFVILLTTKSWLDIGNGVIWSRLLVTVAVFFSTGDFAWIAYQFYRLHLMAERTFTKAHKLTQQGSINTLEIFRLMDDYNCALIQTPPIPDKCYEYYSDKLNEAWRQAHLTAES